MRSFFRVFCWLRQKAAAGLVVSLLWPFGLWADSVHEQAIEAMQQGNFAVAFCLWWPQANQGHAEAQYSIGWMFHNGYGLRINDEVALHWWQQSAEQGNADAMYSLAQLYRLGHGTEKDLETAHAWQYQAVAKQHPEATSEWLETLKDNQPEALQTLVRLLEQPDWQPRNLTPLTVSVARANVREQGQRDARLLATLEQNTRLLGIQEKDGWWQAFEPGLQTLVWVYAPLVSGSDDTQTP